MKGEQISDALQMLRDDTIEETEQVRGGKRKPARRRIWTAAAVAACLCIVVGAVVVQTAQNTDDGRITAEKITEYSGEQILGGATETYITKQADALQDLMWSPIQDNSEVAVLPVYQPKTINNLNRYADECTEFFAQELSDVLSVSTEVKEGSDIGHEKDFWRTDSISCNEWTATVRVQNTYGAVQAQYILAAPDGIPLLGTVVPVDAGDEEILAVVSPILDVFNVVFGKNYKAQVVSRRTDTEQEWVYVHAWENAGDPAQQMYSTYMDYVYITFTNTYASDKSELHLCSAWHTVNELESISETDTPLLSLAEAEEELEQGYIFLGHVCPVCVSMNTEVDFTDYDGVEIVYRGGTFFTYNIPYYAFYKQTEEETFAVTYVPAVKVEGMEEYFKTQESWHS